MPRKVFTAGEILTAADVNTNLMDQAVMVFADSTARTAAIPTPVEGMVTYLEDVGGAQGLEVFDGAAFTPVAIEPDPPAILQVVSTTLTTNFSVSIGSGGTAPVTGLSATITPTSTSSKIFCLAQVTMSNSRGDLQSVGMFFRRGGTAIGIGDASGSRTRGSSAFKITTGDGDSVNSIGFNFLDSPSSTSALTYDVALLSNDDIANTYFVNRSRLNTNDARGVQAASTITLMEVAG